MNDRIEMKIIIFRPAENKLTKQRNNLDPTKAPSAIGKASGLIQQAQVKNKEKERKSTSIHDIIRALFFCRGDLHETKGDREMLRKDPLAVATYTGPYR